MLVAQNSKSTGPLSCSWPLAYDGLVVGVEIIPSTYYSHREVTIFEKKPPMGGILSGFMRNNFMVLVVGEMNVTYSVSDDGGMQNTFNVTLRRIQPLMPHQEGTLIYAPTLLRLNDVFMGYLSI
jgi:hypothetical protein